MGETRKWLMDYNFHVVWLPIQHFYLKFWKLFNLDYNNFRWENVSENLDLLVNLTCDIAIKGFFTSQSVNVKKNISASLSSTL